MNIQVNTRWNSAVAVIESGAVVVSKLQDALDLIATVSHAHGCCGMLLPKTALDESFFDLRTGFAGEVLQKCVNYSMRIAIVGDFSGYESKALRDFIRESNRGKHVFFLPTEAEALDALHC